MTFAGHAAVGLVTSWTMTWNVQLPVLPDVSVAVHVTSVVPTGKDVPEAGTHDTVALPQLSLAVGVVKVAVAEHALAGALTFTVAGHVTLGAVESLSVTVNVHVA